MPRKLKQHQRRIIRCKHDQRDRLRVETDYDPEHASLQIISGKRASSSVYLDYNRAVVLIKDIADAFGITGIPDEYPLDPWGHE